MYYFLVTLPTFSNNETTQFLDSLKKFTKFSSNNYPIGFFTVKLIRKMISSSKNWRNLNFVPLEIQLKAVPPNPIISMIFLEPAFVFIPDASEFWYVEFWQTDAYKLQENEYEINTTMLPYYIPLSLAQKILFIGKSIVLFDSNPFETKQKSLLIFSKNDSSKR